MLYKKLFFQIILRVILITVNAILLAYIYFLDRYLASQINLLALLIIQGILLVHYLNKTNRELSNFFSSIMNNDSTIFFADQKNNRSYNKLHQKLNEVNKIIEQARIDKIGHYEYLKQVVDHVGIGILSFDENMEVQFFNPAGKDILKISQLKSISDLDKLYPGLSQKISKLSSQNQQLITIKASEYELDLTVKLVEFRIAKSSIKLLAFQDIQSELNKKEVESWQKIIRVLTHEIMNSVSPIDSATTSISRLYSQNDTPAKPEDINEEIIAKTIKGMNIIKQRSKGMLDFVQRFRDLTLLPEPEIKPVNIKELFHSIITLLKNELEKNKISYQINTNPENIFIRIDQAQIEQVLINLIRNSIESLNNTENPNIILSSFKNDKNQTIIEVKDNGCGIKKDIIDHIFTPFFTTKATGSGIGLSLSQQIMYLHGGNISVKSELNVETLFTLSFN